MLTMCYSLKLYGFIGTISMCFVCALASIKLVAKKN
jgi:hypothetical protein